MRVLSVAVRTRRRWTSSFAFSPAERAFGRGHLVGCTGIDRERNAQGPRQAFEAGFRDVMVIRAVERRDVYRHSAVHRECLEPLLHQFGIEATHLVAHELGIEYEKWPTRNVNPHA